VGIPAPNAAELGGRLRGAPGRVSEPRIDSPPAESRIDGAGPRVAFAAGHRSGPEMCEVRRFAEPVAESCAGLVVAAGGGSAGDFG